MSSSPGPYTKETLSALSSKSITADDAMKLTMENRRDPFNFSPEWERCQF